jgi:hypothetical protein
LSMVFFPAGALTEECPESKPVASGSVNDCDGVLMPTAWVQESITCLKADLPECLLGQQFLQKRLDQCEDHVASETHRCEKVIQEIIKNSDEFKHGYVQPWYKNQWLWFGGGLLIGGGTVYYLR